VGRRFRDGVGALGRRGESYLEAWTAERTDWRAWDGAGRRLIASKLSRRWGNVLARETLRFDLAETDTDYRKELRACLVEILTRDAARTPIAEGSTPEEVLEHASRVRRCASIGPHDTNAFDAVVPPARLRDAAGRQPRLRSHRRRHVAKCVDMGVSTAPVGPDRDDCHLVRGRIRLVHRVSRTRHPDVDTRTHDGKLEHQVDQKHEQDGDERSDVDSSCLVYRHHAAAK